MSDSTHMKYIYSFKDLPAEAFPSAGGKARSLAHMIQKTKLPIPEGYVILCDSFEGVTGDEGVAGVPALKKDALAELENLLKQLDPKATYAVRSSAVSEDGEHASFAGQYETLTDVRLEEIPAAVETVAASVGNENVSAYSQHMAQSDEAERDNNVTLSPHSIAVVIQKFVKAEFAGVLFTADPVTGRDDFMVGNYVRGAGEQLVSGASNAEVFSLKMIRGVNSPYDFEGTSDSDQFSEINHLGGSDKGQNTLESQHSKTTASFYTGPSEFARYAKRLKKYAKEIRSLYGMHMDIEWVAAGGKLYIVQARPITTLTRLDMDTYEVNGSSGGKLLTKTNVGEIFMQPVSPMTFSVLEKINNILGLPDWLDNIYGQPYMNISVLVSFLVAFGAKKEKAVETLKGLVGNIPDGFDVPISPFDRKALFRKMFVLIFPKRRSKLSKAEKRKMVAKLPLIAQNMMAEIRTFQTEEELVRYWENAMVPKLVDCMSAIMGQSGTSLFPLFQTRDKIKKVAGEEMALRLTGGCLGMMESMKSLFLLEDVRSGKMSKEEYLSICGQRCPNEMELMAPRPYEDPEYVEKLLNESGEINLDAREIQEKQKTSDFDSRVDLQNLDSNVKRMEQKSAEGDSRNTFSRLDPYKMQEEQKRAYEEALAEFKEKYPSKKKWIDRTIASFVQANAFREDLRSKGVWLFCVFREYLLTAGRITGLGDDIFMFTFDEIFAFLKGDRALAEKLPARRAQYEKYLQYEAFPNLVIGRFDPDKWMADPGRRRDIFPAEAGDGMRSGLFDTKCDSPDPKTVGAGERYGSEEKSGAISGAMKEADAHSAEVTESPSPNIKGFPGAAGVVRGRVRVVLDVSRIGEILEGEILVTAATNVGWTPVFPKVAAIVTDIGAPLSHAAIIARECGIPAVVGCGNATTVLHTGDEVTVDGGKGTVTITKTKT